MAQLASLPIVNSSVPAQGNASGLPACVPVTQISAHSVALAASPSGSRASVVLAGSEFSTTVDGYHGGLPILSFGRAGGARSARRKARSMRPPPGFQAFEESIYY